MAEPIIYKDSPLGDYLEGKTSRTGVDEGTGTFESDWGFSSDHEEEDKRDFAPPSRVPRKRFNTTELRPLIMADESISRTAKFYNLFSVYPRQFTDIDFLLITCPSTRNRSVPRTTEVYHMHFPIIIRKNYTFIVSEINPT